MVPSKKNELPVRLLFEVNITDVVPFYELKCRTRTNRSIIIEGHDYEISYIPTADWESLRFMIAITLEENMELLFIDASNVFKTNVIFNPKDRQYVVVPILHLK